jgi:hypothetical protein
MSRSLFAACAFAMVAATASHAQRFGSSGASGFGSGSFGSGSFGNSSFGSSNFGSSAFGGSSFGSSSFGGGGFGSGMGSGLGGMSSGMGGFGNSGFGGGGGFGNSSFGNQGMGGYGGQSFVGRDSADMAATWNQMGQAGAQMFNQMNRAMSRNTNRQQDDAVKVENVPQPMRVNLKVAFTSRRPSPADLTSTIRTRFGAILAAQNIVAPQLTMEGDVAVLSGVAATESQRIVLEKLIAMEPGVRAVRNEMTVVAPSATESLPATGN